MNLYLAESYHKRTLYYLISVNVKPHHDSTLQKTRNRANNIYLVQKPILIINCLKKTGFLPFYSFFTKFDRL
jgi:hypothetical protein